MQFLNRRENISRAVRKIKSQYPSEPCIQTQSSDSSDNHRIAAYSRASSRLQAHNSSDHRS